MSLCHSPVSSLGPLLLGDEHKVPNQQLELVLLPGHVGVQHLVHVTPGRPAVVAVEPQLPGAGGGGEDVVCQLLQGTEVLLRELVSKGQMEGFDDRIRLQTKLPDVFTQVLGQLLEENFLLLLHEQAKEVG